MAFSYLLGSSCQTLLDLLTFSVAWDYGFIEESDNFLILKLPSSFSGTDFAFLSFCLYVSWDHFVTVLVTFFNYNWVWEGSVKQKEWTLVLRMKNNFSKT